MKNDRKTNPYLVTYAEPDTEQHGDPSRFIKALRYLLSKLRYLIEQRF